MGFCFDNASLGANSQVIGVWTPMNGWVGGWLSVGAQRTLVNINPCAHASMMMDAGLVRVVSGRLHFSNSKTRSMYGNSHTFQIVLGHK
jgi:hypothetical protein